MNRQEYINRYVGNIDIGDKVELLESTRSYTPSVTGIVKDIIYSYGIRFTVDCEDATGKKFEYYNASLGGLKKCNPIVSKDIKGVWQRVNRHKWRYIGDDFYRCKKCGIEAKYSRMKRGVGRCPGK